MPQPRIEALAQVVVWMYVKYYYTAAGFISGLGYRPMSSVHEGSNLIRYKAIHQDSHKHWTEALEEFLEGG
jgi:hypothetical protein